MTKNSIFLSSGPNGSFLDIGRVQVRYWRKEDRSAGGFDSGRNVEVFYWVYPGTLSMLRYFRMLRVFLGIPYISGFPKYEVFLKCRVCPKYGVTRFSMIFKTGSGRGRYRQKYQLAGRVRVPVGDCTWAAEWFDNCDRQTFCHLLFRVACNRCGVWCIWAG